MFPGRRVLHLGRTRGRKHRLFFLFLILINFGSPEAVLHVSVLKGGVVLARLPTIKEQASPTSIMLMSTESLGKVVKVRCGETRCPRTPGEQATSWGLEGGGVGSGRWRLKSTFHTGTYGAGVWGGGGVI